MDATLLPLPSKTLMRWFTLDLAPDPDQPRRHFSEESLQELAQSMMENGQFLPLIVYRDPANANRAIIVDGERRFRAALRCPKPMDTLEVLVLPEKPNAFELLKAQLAINQDRQSLTPAEECAAYSKLMAEGNLTQVELARELGVSSSKVSKVLSRQRIAPELLPRIERLEATVVPIIARLPVEAQRELVDFATAPTEAGRLPTRDQVQAYLEAKKPAKPAARAKQFAGVIAGRPFRLGLEPDDDHDKLANDLKSLIAFVQKHKSVALCNLSVLARA